MSSMRHKEEELAEMRKYRIYILGVSEMQM